MTEKQKNLFKLFLEVDEICRKHNLRYVMSGGTLIGVWRHEGFIPWDDDMDIYMPRSDWEKFAEICKTELPPNRALLCSDVDRRYTNSFPRYADTESSAIHRHQIVSNDVAGEIIDVLTLDPIPDDDNEFKKYLMHFMVYSELLNTAVVYGTRFEIPLGMYLKYLFSYYFLGKVRTLEKLEKIMFSYKEEECSRYAMRWGGYPFLFDKDMMFPVKEGIFEGTKVMIPQRTSDYLIWHYGDEWSYIPPHEGRESHDVVESLVFSYKEVREEYIGKVSKKRILFEAIWRKIRSLRYAKKNNALTDRRREIKARAEELDLQERLQEAGRNITEFVEERNFKWLSDFFSHYFAVQLSADFIGREDFRNIRPFYHPVLIRMEDDVFYAAVMTLFYTERIAKAYRMLQLREKYEHLTPEMEKIKSDVEYFRRAAALCETGDTEGVKKICRELLERYPENPGFMKMLCRILVQDPETDRAAAEQFVKDALALFPDDGYFLKYQADLLWMKGKNKNALKIYARVRENTENGVVILEMERQLRKYKDDVIKTCENLLENKDRQEALELLEPWKNILPEDEEIQAARLLVEIACAESQSQVEEYILEITGKISMKMTTPREDEEADKPETEGLEIYKKALIRGWRRLGYAKELAGIRTEAVCASQESELEWLAEQARSELIHKERKAQAYKIIGDIRLKQGRTKEAFARYLEALDYVDGQSYIRTELYRIIMEDLSWGSRRAIVYAKKSDAMPFLDSWLGKYGDISDILEITDRLVYQQKGHEN